MGGCTPELPPREVGDPDCSVFDGSWEMGIAEKLALPVVESTSGLEVAIELTGEA